MSELTEDRFNKIISEPKSEHLITVEGTNIYYQKWGDSKNPGLVLVHGSGAHSHWWDFIAPLLTNLFEVSAIDLAGMGQSDHRNDYSPEIFGREILAVAEDSGFYEGRPSNPILCGHSLGGYMSVNAANQAKKKVKGVIIIDSPIRPPNFDFANHRGSGPIRKRKTYPDKKTILSRFRLAPEQPVEHQFITDYIAKYSIQSINGGYEWRFDDTLFQKLGFDHMERSLAFELNCPLGIIYGTKSDLINQTILDYIKNNISEDTPLIGIEDAYHHVPLDKPFELAESIIQITKIWKI